MDTSEIIWGFAETIKKGNFYKEATSKWLEKMQTYRKERSYKQSVARVKILWSKPSSFLWKIVVCVCLWNLFVIHISTYHKDSLPTLWNLSSPQPSVHVTSSLPTNLTLMVTENVIYLSMKAVSRRHSGCGDKNPMARIVTTGHQPVTLDMLLSCILIKGCHLSVRRFFRQYRYCLNKNVLPTLFE